MLNTNRQPQGKEATELELNQQRFDAIVETMHDGVLILDAEGAVLFGNARAGELLGRPLSELMGTVVDVPWPDADGSEIELERPRNGGGYIQMRVQSTNWCGQDARLVVLTDITPRKEMEVELARARETQLRMKDELLSRVSHELRSPLTAVYQCVTVLLDGLVGEISSDQREYLAIALRNVKQLKAMIGDLLDVTRSKTGKLVVAPHEMDLTRAIASAMDTVNADAQAKNVRLSAEVSEELPAVYADPQRVQQVLVNLLDNAIKFTPSGGAVRLGAKASKETGPSGTAFLEVSVSDTGCGIAPEDHERVFQQLYQVDKNIDQKRMGLGLGLYISRDFVARMGGRIWVESRFGEGSTFSFTLPVYCAEHAVVSLVRDRLAQAKAAGRTTALVVVSVPAAPEIARPAWEALKGLVKDKEYAAAYAGARFVALADAEEPEAGRLRDRVRRLAKEAVFKTAPELCSFLSYGVAVAGADAPETAESLMARAAAAAVAERYLLSQKRLIIVDDDEHCLQVFQKYMESLGIQNVKTATGGAALFAELEKEIPDLIVLDIQMPDMNGHEIIGRLKEKPATAKIPIVVISGYVFESTRMMDSTPGTAIPVVSKLKLHEFQQWVQYLL